MLKLAVSKLDDKEKKTAKQYLKGKFSAKQCIKAKIRMPLFIITSNKNDLTKNDVNAKAKITKICYFANLT